MKKELRALIEYRLKEAEESIEEAKVLFKRRFLSKRHL
jgi:hypothetical protein